MRESLCFLQSMQEMRPPLLRKLYNRFGNYRDAALAGLNELCEVVPETLASEIVRKREEAGIDSAYQTLIKQGIDLVMPGDSRYPRGLYNIKSSPVGLYVIGSMPDNERPGVAIIGARNCSAYGRQMAREYSREAAMAGIQVISGMARGVDGVAQKAALHEGGYSCGVLGCGVDICYPPDNKELYDDLCIRGGVISEYRPGTIAMSQFFPARNRIISGIADAVLVVEARERSGTLITVNMALEQGKDIYALPGRTTDMLSYGCNMLIHDGATPLLRPNEFVDEFMSRLGYLRARDAGGCVAGSVDATHGGSANGFYTANERRILSVLDYTPKSISEIYCDLADNEPMALPDIMELLTNMTIQHKIKCVDGGNYYIEGE